jgi:hypothetical protein
VWASAAALALLLLAFAHLTGCPSADRSGPVTGSHAAAALQPALVVSEHPGESGGQVRSDDDCCHHHQLRPIAVNRTVLNPAPPDRGVAADHEPSEPPGSARTRPDDCAPIRARPLHVLHCVSRC